MCRRGPSQFSRHFTTLSPSPRIDEVIIPNASILHHPLMSRIIFVVCFLSPISKSCSALYHNSGTQVASFGRGPTYISGLSL